MLDCCKHTFICTEPLYSQCSVWAGSGLTCRSIRSGQEFVSLLSTSKNQANPMSALRNSSSYVHSGTVIRMLAADLSETAVLDVHWMCLCLWALIV